MTANSFHRLDSRPQGLGAVLTAPIIAFLFVIGGAFNIYKPPALLLLIPPVIFNWP